MLPSNVIVHISVIQCAPTSEIVIFAGGSGRFKSVEQGCRKQNLIDQAIETTPIATPSKSHPRHWSISDHFCRNV